jgi:hypothetical protein
MDWALFWTAVGVGISVIIMLGSLMLYLHSSTDKRLDKIDERLAYIERDHGERLARIEGAFQERGYWESRRTGTEEKK